MSTARLVLQLVFSLGIVLALMWVVSKVLRKASGGKGIGNLDVLARRQLGRGASVSVLRVGDRALVVGVTEHSVQLLAEVGAEEFVAAPETTAPQAPAGARTSVLPPAGAGQLPEAAPAQGPLAGSILAPSTWKQTVDVLRERTARRG